MKGYAANVFRLIRINTTLNYLMQDKELVDNYP